MISAEECAQRKYRSVRYGLVNVLVCESEKLNFEHHILSSFLDQTKVFQNIALLGIVKKGLRERESNQNTGVIPNKVYNLNLFLHQFRLQKSQEDQELTNLVTLISLNYKRGVYKEMFCQHNVNVTLSVAESGAFYSFLPIKSKKNHAIDTKSRGRRLESAIQ